MARQRTDRESMYGTRSHRHLIIILDDGFETLNLVLSDLSESPEPSSMFAFNVGGRIPIIPRLLNLLRISANRALSMSPFAVGVEIISQSASEKRTSTDDRREESELSSFRFITVKYILTIKLLVFCALISAHRPQSFKKDTIVTCDSNVR